MSNTKENLTATGRIPKKQTIEDVKGVDPTAPKKDVQPSKNELRKAHEENQSGIASEVQHDSNRHKEILASRPSKKAVARKLEESKGSVKVSSNKGISKGSKKK